VTYFELQLRPQAHSSGGRGRERERERERERKRERERERERKREKEREMSRQQELYEIMVHTPCSKKKKEERNFWVAKYFHSQTLRKKGQQ
jgi:hypothetical protein